MTKRECKLQLPGAKPPCDPASTTIADMRLPEQTQLRAPSADTFRLSSALESSDVVDVVVLCSCLGLFALYHLWYYTKWRRGSACAPPCGQELLQGDLWSTSVNARGLWCVAMMAGELHLVVGTVAHCWKRPSCTSVGLGKQALS